MARCKVCGKQVSNRFNYEDDPCINGSRSRHMWGDEVALDESIFGIFFRISTYKNVFKNWKLVIAFCLLIFVSKYIFHINSSTLLITVVICFFALKLTGIWKK